MPRPENQPIQWKAIVNRMAWLAVFVIVFFSLILGTKILGLKIATEVNVNAEVLLAFLVSFISLLLSIMFYFKAEETSNRFYDNTYKFSSDISTAIAEVKSEFGEHLKNLDKGYERLAGAVAPVDILKPLEDTKRELEAVDKSKSSHQKAEDLDKRALITRVHTLQKKITNAEEKISKLLDQTSSPVRDRALSYTRQSVVKKLGGSEIKHISDQEISRRFRDLAASREVPKRYIEDLQSLSYIDGDRHLSAAFIDLVRGYSHQLSFGEN